MCKMIAMGHIHRGEGFGGKCELYLHLGSHVAGLVSCQVHVHGL